MVHPLWFMAAVARWFPVLLGLIMVISAGEARADEYRSRLVTIEHDGPGQLAAFAEKIRPGAVTKALSQVLLGSGGRSSGGEMEPLVDELFMRVQQILDMPMPKLRVDIRLFRNQRILSAECERLTGKPTDAPAFYFKGKNTIHLHMERLSIGILAHEMAHCIMDHYFVIQPPPKISEMLCQYVDREVSGGRF